MLKYFKFLSYVSHLSICLVAMEPSSISVPLPGHPQEFRRADPFACERQQMTDEEFVKHLTTLSLQDNGDAHYELFKIFSRGSYGQRPNYKQALEAGFKARNRPDPIPEILIELPLFALKIHEILKLRNDDSAVEYLFVALNLSPITFFHGFFSAEEMINTYSASGPAMRPIDLKESILAHKSKKEPTLSYTNDLILTQLDSNQEYTSKIFDCVKKYVLAVYGILDEILGISTVKNVRLRYLYWMKLALEKVCNTEFYPFFMLNQARALWMDHRLLEAYLKCFSKPEDLALLKLFASKMGSPEWDPSQSFADKARSSKAIERACHQMMLNSYYIPALAAKACEEESENPHQALASYLTLAKFSPRDTALNNYLFHLEGKAGTIVGKQLFQRALISILPIYLQFAHSNVPELRLHGFNGYLTWIQYRDDVSAIQQAERIIEAAVAEFPHGKAILGNAGRIYCFFLNNVKGFDLLHQLVKEEPSAGPFLALAEAYLYFGYKVTDSSELEALKWYLRAADSGHPIAIKVLNDLKSLIRSSLSSQREKEDQSEWIPQHLKQKPKARGKGKHKVSKRSNPRIKKPENTNHNSVSEMLTVEEPSDEMLQHLQHYLYDPAKEAATVEEKFENASSADKASSKAELEETALDESAPTWQLYNKPKVNNPKTMREILRRMAMLNYFQENANKTDEEFKLNLNTNQKLTLTKIFDLTKPTIMEKEFLQFANAECFHNKFRLFKTTSGFALTAINGLIAEQEERSAGTHWLHGSKRDGLDWNFVAKVRKVLDNLNIRPDLI